MTDEDRAATPPTRAWQLVLGKIENDLTEGRLGPGDRLQPERELAATLGVGRSSVREALRVLEVMGLIRTGTGSGPTSGAIITATPQGGLSALLRLQVAAQGFPPADVVRTRLALETEAMRALAAHPERSVADARTILEAQRQEGLAPEDFLALDAQFHLSLAEATGNVVLAAMMAGLRSSIESYVQQGVSRITDWDAATARLCAEHGAILDALDAGDGPLAADRLRAHITGYFRDAGLDRPPSA